MRRSLAVEGLEPRLPLAFSVTYNGTAITLLGTEETTGVPTNQ